MAADPRLHIHTHTLGFADGSGPASVCTYIHIYQVSLMTADPRLPKLSQAILEDREIQKSVWLVEILKSRLVAKCPT